MMNKESVISIHNGVLFSPKIIKSTHLQQNGKVKFRSNKTEIKKQVLYIVSHMEALKKVKLRVEQSLVGSGRK